MRSDVTKEEGFMAIRCRVCNQDTNREFKPLVSEHAEANHIGGKVKSGDYQHSAWLREILPELDYEDLKAFEIANEIKEWIRRGRIVGTITL